MPANLSSSYWDSRYQLNKTTWDIGSISTPLKTYFEQLKDKSISILIPGCGNSYEAAWLLENGFTNITLIDIAEGLVATLREKFGPALAPGQPTDPAVVQPASPASPKAQVPAQSTAPAPPLRLIAGDFFELTGQYDLIVEQTFFCALDPSLRKNYVKKMYDLLLPGGKLVGLLFDREFNGGPPFGGHKEEYISLLEKRFTIRTLAPCYNSISPRAGTELFFITEKAKL